MIHGCLPKDALFPRILFSRERKLEYSRASDRELRHYKRNQKKTKLGGWGGSAGKGACHQARLPESYSQNPLLESKNWLSNLSSAPYMRPTHTYMCPKHTHMCPTHTHMYPIHTCAPYTHTCTPYIHTCAEHIHTYAHTYITQTTWLLHLECLRKYEIKSKDSVATFKQSISFKFLT